MPPYATESVFHPHNWFLAQAADWGCIGLLGLLLALALPAWRIIRSLDAAADQADDPHDRKPIVPAAESRGPACPEPVERVDAALKPGATGSLSASASSPLRTSAQSADAGCQGPVDAAFRPRTRAVILLAALTVLACWSLVAIGPWDASLTWAAAASLAAAILVGLSNPSPRIAPMLLLAGLVGFLVHASVEMTAGVPGATWPFWAMLSLTLAWTTSSPAPLSGPASEPPPPGTAHRSPAASRTRPSSLAPRPSSLTPRPSSLAPRPSSLAPEHSVLSTQYSVLVLLFPIAVALAVIILSVRPIQSISRMDDARQAIRDNRPDRAVTLLRDAAAADPLDPVSLKAAALLRQKIARQDPAHARSYQADAVAIFRAAVQRDPLSFMTWRNLALAQMHLAVQTDDFDTVAGAVAAMQHALALYPNWPAGALELAAMAGVQSETHPDRPDLLRIALKALARAEALDDLWPPEDPRKFTPADRTRIRQMRQDFSHRLAAATSHPTR